MSRAIFIAILTAGVLIGGTSCAGVPAFTARGQLEQGISLYQRGQIRAAIEQLEGAVARDPTLAEAYLYLARAYLSLGDWMRALATISDGMKRIPLEEQQAMIADLVSALVDSALGLLKAGKPGEATSVLTQTLELAPESDRVASALTDALVVHGRALLDQGKWDAAVDEFRRALALAPDTLEAYLGLARALLASGDLGQALDAVRRALNLAPKDGQAQELLRRLIST